MLRRLATLVAGSIFFFAFTVASAAAPALPWARYAAPVFVHVDTRALPEAAVMALAQDTTGFLWVATQGGLARFDGDRFRTFLPDPSDARALPDGYLRTLLPAADGGLWIGSSSDGLVRYDAASETFRTWRRDPAGRSGPTSASVDALFAAGGALWIGGDGGLSRYDLRLGRFEAVPLGVAGTPPVVWSLTRDRAGAIWAGTQAGLLYRPPGARTFRRYAPAHGSALNRPVYSLYEDGAGRLWAGSVNAVFALDPARRSLRVWRAAPDDPGRLAPGQQWSITSVRDGEIWVGTDDAISDIDAARGGVRRIVADARPAGLPDGRVLGFVHDRSGLLWLADHVGGLVAFNPASHGLAQIATDQPALGFEDRGSAAVTTGAGGELWVGGFAGRLAEIPPHGAVRRLDLPNRAAVESLLGTRDGGLWIGTTGGLCTLRPGAALPACLQPPSPLAGPSIYTLAQVGSRLWVGGSMGLALDDPATGRATVYPGARTFANDQVRVLFPDRAGRLWVGTENGLNRIDPGGHLVRYTFKPDDPYGIGPGGTTTMVEDRGGRIWAGANGGPLDVFAPDGAGGMRVRRLGVADGLPHENVDGLAEDAAGRIWASTDRGIAVIDPETLRARALGPADGVSDGAFWAGAVTQTRDGTIVFGGLEGVTAIAPGAGSPWTYAPPVVVTALEIGQRFVPAWSLNRPSAEVRLPADARDLSIEFAALDFSAPQALQYAYKLDGYDADWKHGDAMHRVATYTHLSPGTYELDVRGSNRLGEWSPHELRIRVVAEAPWYETWWFRALLVGLIALAATLAYRVRIAVLRRRERALERLVAERTLALSQANAQLQEMSLSDPLTGLRNRRFLDKHLDSDIAMTIRRYGDWNASRSGPPPHDADMLFFLIDLDNFKIVNDRFGHHGGDMLLTHMRERLQEVFRESDFVVRWGGDEFLTVARASARTDGAMLAERIREAVASRPFALGGEQFTDATVSVGFAAFPFIETDPTAVTWSHVVALADQALYMAKQAGRNAWFGLTATHGTDPAVLVQRLEGPADVLVRAAALEPVRSTQRVG